MDTLTTVIITSATTVVAAIIGLIGVCIANGRKMKDIQNALNSIQKNQLGVSEGDSSIAGKLGVDINTPSIADRLGVSGNEPSIADRIGVSKNEPSLSSQIGIFQKSDYSLSAQHKELAKLMQRSIDASEKRYNDEENAIKNFTSNELDSYRSIEEFRLLLDSWVMVSKANGEMSARITELETKLNEAYIIIDEKEKIIANLTEQPDDNPKQGFSQTMTMQ